MPFKTMLCTRSPSCPLSLSLLISFFGSVFKTLRDRNKNNRKQNPQAYLKILSSGNFRRWKQRSTLSGREQEKKRKRERQWRNVSYATLLQACTAVRIKRYSAGTAIPKSTQRISLLPNTSELFFAMPVSLRRRGPGQGPSSGRLSQFAKPVFVAVTGVTGQEEKKKRSQKTNLKLIPKKRRKKTMTEMTKLSPRLRLSFRLLLAELKNLPHIRRQLTFTLANLENQSSRPLALAETQLKPIQIPVRTQLERGYISHVHNWVFYQSNRKQDSDLWWIFFPLLFSVFYSFSQVFFFFWIFRFCGTSYSSRGSMSKSNVIL